MSRLDSFIRRACAQRDCLDLAARLVSNLPGPVLELGLGNGRTYDHLRERLPGREIYVFERRVAAHPDCVPDFPHLFLGDIRDTLPGVAARLGEGAAIAHADLGSGNPAADAALAEFVDAALPPLMKARGLIVSDQKLAPAGCEPIPLPAGIEPGRYYIFRVR